MSLLVPDQAMSPLLIKIIFSPISITEFISCELTMVVILNSCVISKINLSMMMDVLGSRPEFGSSQKRYFGLSEMALAIATRFCIPPLISEGKRWYECSGRLTLSRQNLARSSISFLVDEENISRGYITFSITVRESNRAEP